MFFTRLAGGYDLLWLSILLHITAESSQTVTLGDFFHVLFKKQVWHKYAQKTEYNYKEKITQYKRKFFSSQAMVFVQYANSRKAVYNYAGKNCEQPNLICI